MSSAGQNLSVLAGARRCVLSALRKSSVPIISRSSTLEALHTNTFCDEWESGEGGYDTKVEMTFKAIDAQSTMVQIRESGWRETPKGIESSYGNAGGWMHMMCCMKAYLEHGINLRAGDAACAAEKDARVVPSTPAVVCVGRSDLLRKPVSSDPAGVRLFQPRHDPE